MTGWQGEDAGLKGGSIGEPDSWLGCIMTEALIPVSGFPLSELNVCRHCRDAVSTLPCSADDEGEEGEDQDDDDDEAAAVRSAAIDAALPLVSEFPVGAHLLFYSIQYLCGVM